LNSGKRYRTAQEATAVVGGKKQRLNNDIAGSCFSPSGDGQNGIPAFGTSTPLSSRHGITSEKMQFIYNKLKIRFTGLSMT
jgi:hypothetical protein